jgi:hypothetical protein
MADRLSADDLEDFFAAVRSVAEDEPEEFAYMSMPRLLSSLSSAALYVGVGAHGGAAETLRRRAAMVALVAATIFKRSKEPTDG